MAMALGATVGATTWSLQAEGTVGLLNTNCFAAEKVVET